MGDCTVKSAMEEDAKQKKHIAIIYKNIEGVCIHGRTLASLHGILDCFKSTGLEIPVNAINLSGTVCKEHVMETSLMLEKKIEYAVIFAHDIRVTPEASELAHQLGVKIYTSHTISELRDQAMAFFQNL